MIGIRKSGPMLKLAYGPNRRYWSVANPTKTNSQKISFFMVTEPSKVDRY